jgi:hypothetical protein
MTLPSLIVDLLENCVSPDGRHTTAGNEKSGTGLALTTISFVNTVLLQPVLVSTCKEAVNLPVLL